jgi:hypothetical protein
MSSNFTVFHELLVFYYNRIKHLKHNHLEFIKGLKGLLKELDHLRKLESFSRVLPFKTT